MASTLLSRGSSSISWIRRTKSALMYEVLCMKADGRSKHYRHDILSSVIRNGVTLTLSAQGQPPTRRPVSHLRLDKPIAYTLRWRICELVRDQEITRLIRRPAPSLTTRNWLSCSPCRMWGCSSVVERLVRNQKVASSSLVSSNCILYFGKHKLGCMQIS